MLKISAGDTIEVFDLQKSLIGKGTYQRTHLHIESKLTQYECIEASIVADGEHLVKINNGPFFKVSEPKTW